MKNLLMRASTACALPVGLSFAAPALAATRTSAQHEQLGDGFAGGGLVIFDW
jgi:hypothetical protein